MYRSRVEYETIPFGPTHPWTMLHATPINDKWTQCTTCVTELRRSSVMIQGGAQFPRCIKRIIITIIYTQPKRKLRLGFGYLCKSTWFHLREYPKDYMHLIESLSYRRQNRCVLLLLLLNSLHVHWHTRFVQQL